jgi:hypothetical protein
LPWLIVTAVLAAVSFCWWGLAWTAGAAPLPFPPLYLLVAYGTLAVVTGTRAIFRPGAPGSNVTSLLVGATLLGVAGSLFLPLKVAIPNEIPFWVDLPLADAERRLFGADPWRILDPFLGWSVVPMDLIYGLWLPVELLVLFTILAQPASRAKSRALIAYSLAWFLLGVVAAALFSSVGPIFYDGIFGGNRFAGLHEMLREKGAWMTLAESGAMWSAHRRGGGGIVAGISAMPSIHVAVSLWIYLSARTMAPRWTGVALVYFALIWLGSVQLGWHYVADGLVGAVGMLGVWGLASVAVRKAGRLDALARSHGAADD